MPEDLGILGDDGFTFGHTMVRQIGTSGRFVEEEVHNSNLVELEDNHGEYLVTDVLMMIDLYKGRRTNHGG